MNESAAGLIACGFCFQPGLVKTAMDTTMQKNV